MKEIERQLIRILQETDRPMGSMEIAEAIGISKTKIKSIIKDMNDELEPYCAQIVGRTGLGNGYTLVVDDPEAFNDYLEEYLPNKLKDQAGLFSNQESRVNYISQRLLQSGDFIKADDLADELAVSKNQLSKDLKLVRKKLKKVGIEITNKPYYGLGIEADEIVVRQCLAKMESERIFSANYATTYSENDTENVLLAQIKTIVINECEKFNYHLVDMTCENLVTHLYIAVKRAEKQYLVHFSDEDKEVIENEKEFDLAKAIIYDIQSYLGVSLSKNEIYYCTIHLCSKKSLDTEYAVSGEIQKLVFDMLKYLDEERETDFSSDFRLALRLSLHMVPFVSRIRYQLELKNPMLEEIKSRYIAAFEFASVCADFLNKRYDTCLSEHEIGYIALHIQLSINDQKNENKKRIIIVCSTGRGSAALLKVKFKQNYGKYIDKVVVCDYLGFLKMNTEEYDYVFSTIPLKDYRHPYILISHFLDSNDDKKIVKILEEDKNGFYQYFNESLFMNHIKASTKEEVIQLMVDNLNKYKQIPDEFYDSVIKRESLAKTCFGNGIAMPHPYKTLSDETFISVGILDKPIEWQDDENVRVVLLCSFESKFAKHNEYFFECLSEIISSEATVKELSHAESYYDFINIMKGKLSD